MATETMPKIASVSNSHAMCRELRPASHVARHSTQPLLTPRTVSTWREIDRYSALDSPPPAAFQVVIIAAHHRPPHSSLRGEVGEDSTASYVDGHQPSAHCGCLLFGGILLNGCHPERLGHVACLTSYFHCFRPPIEQLTAMRPVHFSLRPAFECRLLLQNAHHCRPPVPICVSSAFSIHQSIDSALHLNSHVRNRRSFRSGRHRHALRHCHITLCDQSRRIVVLQSTAPSKR